MSRNEITGDSMTSKANSHAYADNYERIFNAKQNTSTSETNGCGCARSEDCEKSGDSSDCCKGIQSA